MQISADHKDQRPRLINHRPPQSQTPAPVINLSSPPASPKDTQPSPPPKQRAPSVPAPYLSTSDTISEAAQAEKAYMDRSYGLDCTIWTRQNLGHGHRIQHPQLYRLCSGGLLSRDLLRALLELNGTSTPTIYTSHIGNWVRDPLRSNTPTRSLLQRLYKAEAVLLLHNHDNVH